MNGDECVLVCPKCDCEDTWMMCDSEICSEGDDCEACPKYIIFCEGCGFSAHGREFTPGFMKFWRDAEEECCPFCDREIVLDEYRARAAFENAVSYECRCGGFLIITRRNGEVCVARVEVIHVPVG